VCAGVITYSIIYKKYQNYQIVEIEFKKYLYSLSLMWLTFNSVFLYTTNVFVNHSRHDFFVKRYFFSKTYLVETKPLENNSLRKQQTNRAIVLKAVYWLGIEPGK